MVGAMGRATLVWSDDLLPGFRRLPVGRATLVAPREQVTAPRGVVLHVHGYNDYFFQDHLASAVTASDHAFYALDLARAGRSLRDGDIPHFMTSASEPAADLNAAMSAIAALHPGIPVVVHGHSTGGLTATVWADVKGHPALAGLALNSPLFGLVGARSQLLLQHLVPFVARFRPKQVVAVSRSVYAEHQHVSGGGRWNFDTNLKRPAGVPIRAGWVRAMLEAQDHVSSGVDLAIPVMVARSDTCGLDLPDNPLLDEQDTVVDVEAVAKIGDRLSADVTPLVVPGGVHDLTLSRDAPREYYLSELVSFVTRCTR